MCFEAVLSGLDSTDKSFGDPGGTPTPDLGFRKALLYAAELRGHGGDLASWGDLKKGVWSSEAKKSDVGGSCRFKPACG